MWTCSIFNELMLVSIVLWCSCCCHWAIKCDCECETTREKINQNMHRLMCALTPYVELATHRKSTKAKLSATKSMINSSFGIESLMNDKLAGNHFVLQNRKIEILSTQKFFCFRKKVETEKKCLSRMKRSNDEVNLGKIETENEEKKSPKIDLCEHCIGDRRNERSATSHLVHRVTERERERATTGIKSQSTECFGHLIFSSFSVSHSDDNESSVCIASNGQKWRRKKKWKIVEEYSRLISRKMSLLCSSQSGMYFFFLLSSKFIW